MAGIIGELIELIVNWGNKIIKLLGTKVKSWKFNLI